MGGSRNIFCEYAATLRAGQRQRPSGTISTLQTWRLDAHPVPVVGFIVLDGQIERACTFKNFGGKLTFAGVWARKEPLTEYRPLSQYDDAGMRAWNCLLTTGYYDGE